MCIKTFQIIYWGWFDINLDDLSSWLCHHQDSRCYLGKCRKESKGDNVINKPRLVTSPLVLPQWKTRLVTSLLVFVLPQWKTWSAIRSRPGPTASISWRTSSLCITKQTMRTTEDHRWPSAGLERERERANVFIHSMSNYI